MLLSAWTVNSLGDTGTGLGLSGDLRYVITQVDQTQGDNIINFSVAGMITLNSALPDLNNTSGLTDIEGPGATTLTVARSSDSGTPDFRIFTVDSGADVKLVGLKITGGSANGGGGISNNGTLTVTDSTITDNYAYNPGGGISNYDGKLTVNNSTIANNYAGGGGGGIFNYGTLTVTGSTIAHNDGDLGNGGGIDNYGTSRVANSTIADNQAQINGGGISNIGVLTVTNSTITYNSAGYYSYYGGPYSGGIHNRGTATLNDTIVALNVNSVGAPDDISPSGTIASSSAYNLIGTGGSGGLINGVKGNQVGVASPGLGSLANNGGQTQTIALQAGSPAIDAGSNALTVDGRGNQLTTDQRGAGFPRIIGSAVEIGAFESGMPAPVITWPNPADITYGTPLGSQQLNATASFKGATLPGTFAYTATIGTILNAGQSQTLTTIFTPTDTVVYATSTKSVTINVNKLTPTIAVNGYRTTYDGRSHVASGTATGIGGVSLGGLDLSRANHTTAGNYSDSWFFTDPTGNYNNENGSVSDVIKKTIQAITVSAVSGVYGDKVYAATTNVSAIEGVRVTLDYEENGQNLGPKPPINAGTYVVTANFAGSADYATTHSQPVHFTISPTPLTIVANSGVMVQGAAVPPLSAHYYGLVNGDSSASLTTQATVNSPATPASAPGTYPILVGGASSPNYAISYVNNVLVITSAPVEVIKLSVQAVRLGKTKKTTQVIVLQFTGSLNAESAQSITTYSLATIPSTKKQKSKAVALSQATYNSANNTVRLVTREPLVLKPSLKLTFHLLDPYGYPASGVATLSKKVITF